MVSKRIKDRIASDAPAGATHGKQSRMDAWAEYASRNSYHGEKSRESGDSYLGAKQDNNHAGDSTFEPGVRRQV